MDRLIKTKTIARQGKITIDFERGEKYHYARFEYFKTRNSLVDIIVNGINPDTDNKLIGHVFSYYGFSQPENDAGFEQRLSKIANNPDRRKILNAKFILSAVDLSIQNIVIEKQLKPFHANSLENCELMAQNDFYKLDGYVRTDADRNKTILVKYADNPDDYWQFTDIYLIKRSTTFYNPRKEAAAELSIVTWEKYEKLHDVLQ